MQRFAISTMENNPGLQFVPQEGFEELEHHVEDVGLVHYVDALDTKGNWILGRKANNITMIFLGKSIYLNLGLFTWSQSTILLANGGVNCQTCCIDKPSMSKMTTAPQIWVSGSNIAASKNMTAPLKTSSKLHLLCFHFSKKKQSVNFGRSWWS